MNRQDIEVMIQEGLRIQRLTWKDPMSVLYSNRAQGQPEFIRNLDTSFYSYDSDAEQQKFYNNKIAATTEQQKLAVDVMDLITYACKRHSGNDKMIMRAIISLYCSNLDNPGYGFRKISKLLKAKNIKISYMTVKRRYDTAMDDLVHFHNT